MDKATIKKVAQEFQLVDPDLLERATLASSRGKILSRLGAAFGGPPEQKRSRGRKIATLLGWDGRDVMDLRPMIGELADLSSLLTRQKEKADLESFFSAFYYVAEVAELEAAIKEDSIPKMLLRFGAALGDVAYGQTAAFHLGWGGGEDPNDLRSLLIGLREAVSEE